MNRTSSPGIQTLGRAGALFVNFLLVILAYYQVKAASRSLVIDYGSAEALPWVWIGSAMVLLCFIGVYNRMVARFTRVQVIAASLFLFAVLLVAFWFAMQQATLATAVAFYIFVDIFSVVLVEQFWSLSNTVMAMDEGRNSYWFVGSGGLVGGIVGGLLAGWLISHGGLATVDLLLSCAGMLVLTGAVTIALWRAGLFVESSREEAIPLTGEGLRAVFANRYLLLIAAIICCSQLVQPVVEYQFLSAVSDAYPGRDERTLYISNFFAVMGLVSVAINLLLTPLVHRLRGAITGLLIQPALLALTTAGYLVQGTLAMAAVMKISDRGLSYSINRASKELLYIPVDPVNTYQVKAWIDMLGYRLFKVLGSGLIILLTQWMSLPGGAAGLGWLTLTVCATWTAVIWLLAGEQRRVLVPAPAPA